MALTSAARNPAGPAPGGDGLDELVELLRGRTAVVLAGAGCSTESGIPDYRGPDGRLRARLPMTYQRFVGDASARARYWARSAAGWARFSRARPNDAHRALARLEALGCVRGVITQNVDGLHQGAGSRTVVELHGSLARVRCLSCGAASDRNALQRRLRVLNPGLDAVTAGRVAPDGDVELPDALGRTLRVPACGACGGVLKPDVVFFGENVPRPRLERAWTLYEKGDSLLVVGSSLQVWSGRRFVERAAREGKPVVVVNLGPTRCDDRAALRVDGRLGHVLPHLADALA